MTKKMFAALFFCLTLIRRSDESTCPLEYRLVDPNHSFCASPFANVIEQTITSTDRQVILDMHNNERRLVHGTNMEQMYWNEELAGIALGHARRCIFEHDKPHQRSVPRVPLTTGQNLAMGYENWTETIQGWIEEKEYYVHAYPSNNRFTNYKQMIWHSSSLIGCAMTICPAFGSSSVVWPFYVCNYMRGMLESNYRPAYQRGLTAQPLRDCQGKVCLYNGTLDLKTCECQCSTYASGVQCERLNCSNLPYCPYHSPISCIAADVPAECPRLCGLCNRYEILNHMTIDEDPLDVSDSNFTTDSTVVPSNVVSTPSSIFHWDQINTTKVIFIGFRSSASSHCSQIVVYVFMNYLLVA